MQFDATAFWGKFARQPNGCLEWTGARLPSGYGTTSGNGKTVYTHRLAYELAKGPIPQGMHICHTCDNPPCGEPSHLFAGTRSDNMLDCSKKGRHRSVTHPETIVRGDAHHYRTRPEVIRRGSDHHMNRRPELRKSGEENPSAKLTAEQVLEIRRRYDAGGIGTPRLAREFNVHQALIWRIVKRKAWTHI